jgi:hypothetical protein
MEPSAARHPTHPKEGASRLGPGSRVLAAIDASALLAPPAGLSLGDRACLALAKRLAVPAVTAGQACSGLDVGVAVGLIRPRREGETHAVQLNSARGQSLRERTTFSSTAYRVVSAPR